VGGFETSKFLLNIFSKYFYWDISKYFYLCSSKIIKMIKELVQFTKTALADPIFRNLGVQPREGLHIVLKVEKTEETTKIAEKPLFSGVFAKKTKEKKGLSEEEKLAEMQKEKEAEIWLPKCAAWSQVAWMVDTNKCFDPITKAIHSASPFCFALKRTNLSGGEKWLENESLKKSQVHERVKLYFENAAKLFQTADEQVIGDAFRVFLSDNNHFYHILNETGFLKEDKRDGDYVIFYLDLPVETYLEFNQRYLKEKLFNTPDYNLKDESDAELMHGTSNWLNGFPNKKPFLMHQSATFDISGRITSDEAKVLFDFSELSRRKLFPNPLPLFVMADEREKAFKYFKDDAQSGAEKRKAYLETIGEISNNFKKEIGNYYLLFQVAGELRDFDFVSRFEYNLNSDGSNWKVEDLFNSKEEMKLSTVDDLIKRVLPPMFNNALVVRRKEKDWIFHWFDEMDPAFCETHNAYLMAIKYRKAFYDFIYKSKRQGLDSSAIVEILMSGLLDDIGLDKYDSSKKQNSKRLNICTKLNLLFSLPAHFSPNKKSSFMPDNIIQLRAHLENVAKGEAQIKTDEQFAFSAGQVVARIFYESMAQDRSYKYLEQFLAQTKAERLRMSIATFIKRYSHVEYPPRFRNVSSDVLTFQTDTDFQKLLPTFLAGVFSKTQLYWEKKEKIDPTAPDQAEVTND
jgi:CRISPR-associated protein Csh1